jgi:hypothetical protein
MDSPDPTHEEYRPNSGTDQGGFRPIGLDREPQQNSYAEPSTRDKYRSDDEVEQLLRFVREFWAFCQTHKVRLDQWVIAL